MAKAQGTPPVISFGTEANNSDAWEAARDLWIRTQNRYNAKRLQTSQLLDELEARLGVETIGPVRDMLIEQDVDLEATRREETPTEELGPEVLRAGLKLRSFPETFFDELEDITFTSRHDVHPAPRREGATPPLGVFIKDTST